MKKSLFASIIAAVALLISSCSSDADKLLEGIPAEVDYVVVFNVQTAVESAGGSITDSQIKLPSTVTDFFESRQMNDFEEFNAKLKKSGVDITAIALAGKFKNEVPVVVIKLNDKDKFAKFLDNEDFDQCDSKDGVKYYNLCTYKSDYTDYSSYCYIGIKGTLAYALMGVSESDKPVKKIASFVDQADDKAFSKTKFGDFISEGNTFGAYVKMPREIKAMVREAGLPTEMANLYTGAVCFKGNLSDNKAVVDVKMFDEDGNAKNMKDFENYMNLNAKVSGKALAYMQPDQQLVAAVSLKDVKWGKYFDLVSSSMSRGDRAQLSAIQEYFEKIDGTFAFGLGIKNGLESIVAIERNEENMATQISGTFVIETKDGSAKKLVTDFKNLLKNEGVKCESIDNGFSINIDKDVTIYCKSDDNLIVLSNSPIHKADNKAVKSVDFTDFISAGALVFDKNDKLMQDLGLDYDVVVSMTSDAKTMTATCTAEIKGGNKKGFIAKAIQMGIDAYDNRNKISAKMEEYSSMYKSRWDDFDDYNYYDYADTVAVEEVVEVAE